MDVGVNSPSEDEEPDDDQGSACNGYIFEIMQHKSVFVFSSRRFQTLHHFSDQATAVYVEWETKGDLIELNRLDKKN